MNAQTTKARKLDLKLRQLQFTKLKDLTRDVNEKDKQLKLLNAKVSSLIGGRPHSLRKDSLLGGDFLGHLRAHRVQSSRDDYQQISEAKESFANSSYRTPQKLPNIHKQNKNYDYTDTDIDILDLTPKIDKTRNPKSIYSEMYSNLTKDLKSKKL